MIRLLVFGFFLFLVVACKAPPTKKHPIKPPASTNQVKTGADQVKDFYKPLTGKRIALVVNHTSLIGKTHLADSLKALGLNIVKIFGPEHGFRGNAADGELV